MAAPLEFKRRVRLPELSAEDPVARRRSWAAPAGVLTWVVVVGLAFAIAEGAVPIERWLHTSDAPERLAGAGGPRSAATLPRPEPPSAPFALALAANDRPSLADEPNEPAPLPARAGDDDEPEPPPEPEPEPEPEPLPEPAPLPEPEPAPEPVKAPEPREPNAPAPERAATRSTASAGPSCEQAAAAASQSIEIGKGSGPADLAREDYAVILDRGSYFAHCGVGEHVRIEICAAVQSGRAVGVTVTTTPASPSAASCIARAVRSLGFPSHPRLDVVRTRFE